VSFAVLRWGEKPSIVIEGVSLEIADDIASRWGARLNLRDQVTPDDSNWLLVPDGALDSVKPRNPKSLPRVSTRFRDGVIQVGVGRHRVLLDPQGGVDLIELSPAVSLDEAERELLVSAAVTHLLARQGLATLHACAMEIGGVGVLGLGESFAGKTTVSMAAVRAGGKVVSDDLVLAGVGPTGQVDLTPLRSYWFLRGQTRRIVPKRLTGMMLETSEDGVTRWVLPRSDRQSESLDRSTPEIVWLLSVDRRLREGRVAEVAQAMVFAGLIRASSPIFLSRHCPRERAALMPVFRALSEGCRAFRVRLGRRLLEDPVGEMERLVEASR
jgi:hypothetical protein